MYSGLPLYFKDLFSHKKVLEVLVTGLLQNFRSTVNDTISVLEGSNRRIVFVLILILEKVLHSTNYDQRINFQQTSIMNDTFHHKKSDRFLAYRFGSARINGVT